MTTDYPKFRNDRGVTEIRIGVKEFNCIGVSPPHDHPHVYLNMENRMRSCVLIARHVTATPPDWRHSSPIRGTVYSLNPIDVIPESQSRIRWD